MSFSLILAAALLGLLLGGVCNAIAIHWDTRLKPGYPPSYCTYGHRSSRWAVAPILNLFTSSHRQCPSCGNRTWWRYAAAEPIAGLLFAYSAYLYGFSAELAVSLLFVAVLVIIVQTDITAKIIPNKVVFPAVIGMAVIRLFVHPMPLSHYFLGAVAGSGALLTIGLVAGWLLKKEGMGGGDIKLYVFIGLVLGVKLTLLSLFTASVAGLIGGFMMMAAGKHSRGMTIPFGPFIAIGAIASYWWGDGWTNAYLRLSGFI